MLHFVNSVHGFAKGLPTELPAVCHGRPNFNWLGSANPLPFREASAPGLHTNRSELVRPGSPELTFTVTSADEDCRPELVALNVTLYLPPWEADGIHSKRPLAASKEAPTGTLTAAS